MLGNYKKKTTRQSPTLCLAEVRAVADRALAVQSLAAGAPPRTFPHLLCALGAAMPFLRAFSPHTPVGFRRGISRHPEPPLPGGALEH